MVLLLFLPAVLMVFLSNRGLSARKKHKKIGIYGGLALLLPVVLLMAEAISSAIWTYNNHYNGNGSAEAANGITFLFLSTIAAFYSLIISFFVLPKNVVYTIFMLLLAVSIIVPAIMYEVYY